MNSTTGSSPPTRRPPAGWLSTRPGSASSTTAGHGRTPRCSSCSALVPALDELVVRLVHAGIALRELAPVVSPLEAAFLALTEQQETSR